jgi:ABC-type branched-subunit amino acid transport system substrate-binding protein
MAGSPGAQTAQEVAEPTQAQFGSGSRVVGVLAFVEPHNLSDGDPNSIALAAKLAASTLTGNPVTVLVRTVPPESGAASQVIKELDAAGASIVIGLDDEATAVGIAKAMVARPAPTISLTSFADLGLQLYGAGFVPNEEAVALVNEAARRGYSSLAVVTTEGAASQDFAKAVLGLAGAAGISARAVDGSTDSQFLAGMTALAAAGVPTSAIVFAAGPQRAAAMMAMLKGDDRFKSIALVGNSGWAVAGKLPATLKGAWYTSVSSDGLSDFADKFKAANGAVATLNAAMTYDLLVLAAALPQAVKEEPYHPEVMTNAQGFKGFTGQFRFGPTGMLAARNYVIVTAK